MQVEFFNHVVRTSEPVLSDELLLLLQVHMFWRWTKEEYYLAIS